MKLNNTLVLSAVEYIERTFKIGNICNNFEIKCNKPCNKKFFFNQST